MMLLKGFSFGMILQAAVGPICIYTISTALTSGFWVAFSAVLAVTLVDALFVALAILGIGALIKSNRAKIILKLLGGIVIIYYGIAIFLSAFGLSIMPNFGGSRSFSESTNVFFTALIMTLSNPLTIIFWAGVFGTRLSDNPDSQKNTILFGIGAVLSTLIFLTVIAFSFSLFNPLMTPNTVQWLNGAAGIILAGFGVYMLIKKEK